MFEKKINKRQKIVSKKRAVKPKQRKVRRVKSEDDEW